MDYVLEVDLEYPQHLHDAHTDLPFYPTCEKLSKKREKKLLAMIRSIMYFIIVIYNVLITVSKSQKHALQFAQFPWLHEYIELNTNFRTLANNEFEKNLYKLMNNAVFDKTMDNVRNHVDMRFVTR